MGSNSARQRRFKKATEQPADAGRKQDGPQRPLADEMLAGTREAVNCFSSLSQYSAASLVHLPELLLDRVPYGLAHFMQVFSYFLFAC